MSLFSDKLAKLDRRDLVLDSYFKINQGITNPIKGQKIYGKLKGKPIQMSKEATKMTNSKKIDSKKKLKTSGFLIAAFRDAAIVMLVLVLFVILMLIYNFISNNYKERTQLLADRYVNAIDELSQIGI